MVSLRFVLALALVACSSGASVITAVDGGTVEPGADAGEPDAGPGVDAMPPPLSADCGTLTFATAPSPQAGAVKDGVSQACEHAAVAACGYRHLYTALVGDMPAARAGSSVGSCVTIYASGSGTFETCCTALACTAYNDVDDAGFYAKHCANDAPAGHGKPYACPLLRDGGLAVAPPSDCVRSADLFCCVD